MSTKMLALGLLASSAMAQSDDLADAPTKPVEECTQDTAAKDCAELGTLIKPSCVGNWICTKEARCGWKCDDYVLPPPTEMCPAPYADLSVERAYAGCTDGKFDRVTCKCEAKQEPTCDDQSLLRVKVEDCYMQGGLVQDAKTCDCVMPTLPPVPTCPEDVREGCAKQGGVLEPAPSCTCKSDIFCPEPMSNVLKSTMWEKCKGADLRLDPKTCECMEPVLDVKECKYGEQDAMVPVYAAKRECEGRGPANVFEFDSIQKMCNCKRLAISDASMCAPPLENLSVDFARKACGAKGAFAYPRTSKFNPETCECKPVPADDIEAVDCAPFRSCDKANPCLAKKGDSSRCVPMDATTKQCPADTAPCGRFGAGGAVDSVCPNGDSYEKTKLACKAKDPSIWHPLRCKCEPIVNTNVCKDGSDYDASKTKCLENEGRFSPIDCSCKLPAQVVCADITKEEYAVRKRTCAADPTKFFVEEPHCKCISRDEKPTTLGCEDFTSIREAVRLCPGMAASPPTQMMDKEDCTCRKVVSTKPAESPLPFKQDLKMIICRDDLTVEDVKRAIAKLLRSLKTRLDLRFPDAEIVFDSIAKFTRDGKNCVAIKVSVLHAVKTRLVELINLSKNNLASDPAVLDTVRSDLEIGDAEDKVPVSLAFEADGLITGGESDDPTVLGSASTAAPALVSLVAAGFALFA